MNEKQKKLTDAELEILHILTRLKSATAQQVRENLPREKPVAYSTVITLLQRMEAKGYVTHGKGEKGKAFIFHPALPPDQVRRKAMQSLIDRYFENNPIPLFTTLVETRGLSRDEIDELRAMLDQIEGGKTDREDKT